LQVLCFAGENIAAGNRIEGYDGDGGPATSAKIDISHRDGITINAAGNLSIADDNNHRIRKVTHDGVITTNPTAAIFVYSKSLSGDASAGILTVS
jgi:hypothetical protein